MRRLDPSSSAGMTLYKEVKRQMLAALSAGEWQPGEAIPSEKRLCERFAVSIGTLRKAIDELVAENILIRHQGRGTFVAIHSRDQHLFRFFHLVRHDGDKTYPNLALQSFSRRKIDRTAADKLGLSANARAFCFTNVLSLHDKPVVIDDIVLPEALFAGLTEAMLRQRAGTLYSLYQAEFGLNVIRIEERLRGALATPEQAKLLGLAPGAPLLEIRRLAFSYNNQPVEWRISHIDTRHYEYFVDET